MSAQSVIFHFGYNSPYSFLAFRRVENLLAPLDVEIDYRPFFPRLNLPDPDSPKVKHVVEDVIRHCRRYGLRLQLGPYVDLTLACRGYLYAKQHGAGRPYNDAVHRARWLTGGDISSRVKLCEIASECGFDRHDFASAIEGPELASELERETRDALEAGVFGVPFFRYRDERFWGNDRLEWLEDSIRENRDASAARA